MKQRFLLSCALMLAWALAGCAALPFMAGEVRLSASELTRKLEQRFPLQRDVAGLLDVTLYHPLVELSESDNRIVASFGLTVKPALSSKSLSGSVRVSGRPDYVPETRALYLRDAKVERVRMDNMTDALSAALAKAASDLARESLESRPLHSFQAEDFTRYGMRYTPERILVRGNELVLTLR